MIVIEEGKKLPATIISFPKIKTFCWQKPLWINADRISVSMILWPSSKHKVTSSHREIISSRDYLSYVLGTVLHLKKNFNKHSKGIKHFEKHSKGITVLDRTGCAVSLKAKPKRFRFVLRTLDFFYKSTGSLMVKQYNENLWKH